MGGVCVLEELAYDERLVQGPATVLDSRNKALWVDFYVLANEEGLFFR